MKPLVNFQPGQKKSNFNKGAMQLESRTLHQCTPPYWSDILFVNLILVAFIIVLVWLFHFFSIFFLKTLKLGKILTIDYHHCSLVFCACFFSRIWLWFGKGKMSTPSLFDRDITKAYTFHKFSWIWAKLVYDRKDGLKSLTISHSERFGFSFLEKKRKGLGRKKAAIVQKFDWKTRELRHCCS